jgi:hypothetical protein
MTTIQQLPVVHPVIAASAKRIRKRFTGNMGNEFVVTEPGLTKDQPPLELPAEVSKHTLSTCIGSLVSLPSCGVD